MKENIWSCENLCLFWFLNFAFPRRGGYWNERKLGGKVEVLVVC